MKSSITMFIDPSQHNGGPYNTAIISMYTDFVYLSLINIPVMYWENNRLQCYAHCS